jgi:gliding motility-associated-like protein
LQPIITPTTTTTYLLTGNIPGSGCPDAVLSLTIDVQPYPTITLSDKEKCIGDTLSIQPGISPPYDHYIYSWSPATFLSAASQANVGYFGTGATTLTLITTTPAGCSDTGSMQVSIFPPNHITSTPADTSLCFGDSVQIFVTADSGTTILWTPAIFLSDTTIFVPVSHPRFSIGYTAMLTDIHGCKDTAVSHIRVYPQAMVNVPDSIVLYPGEQTQLNPQGNCLYFKWFPPLGLSNTSIATPIAMPEVNTRYYLTAQTEWGCIAYDTIDVIIDPETAIDVPNAFAPGNGPNAELKVVKKGVATLKSFCIFNRWGEKVFETLDIEKGWDGRVNGVPQPMGVYVYFVEAYTGNGKRFYKQGNITLLR